MRGGREEKRRGEERGGEEGRGETKGKRQADTHFIQFFFNIYASHTAGYY